MTTPTIVKAGNDAAKNDEVVSSKTSATHETGEAVSSATLLQAPAVESPQYFQNVPQHELGNFLSRMVEIRTINISNIDTPFSTITTLDPWSLFLSDPSVVDKTNNFSMIRGTLELLIMSAIPGSCYGSYVFSALPNGGATMSPTTDINVDMSPANCMQLDHYARIDCASAENVVMQLPWIYPYDFAELPWNVFEMYRINLTCLCPLFSGLDGGITTGSFRIFARLLPDAQLVIPRFQGGTRRNGHLHPTSTTAVHMPKMHKKLVSKTADQVGAIADKLSGVPIIGPYAATASKAAHAVSKISHMFGFSRESEQKTPIPITNRSVTNVANIDIGDSNDFAAFNSVCEISTDPTMAGSTPEDILSFASLFNRWTLTHSFTWSTSAVAGDDIATWYVSPFDCSLNSAIGGANNLALTTAGYVGTPFEFWRGDMEYLVVIPTSKFHRGTLQAYWVPFGTLAPDAVTNITVNTILDVGTGEEHQFNVGFARNTPYLQKAYITPDVTIVPAGTANGAIRLRVVNPLISQNPTGNVSILVFARAGSNMDFSFPSTKITYPVPVTGNIYNDIWSAFQLQGGALGDDDTHDETPHDLISSSGDYPGDQLLWGEKISSVRALLQKPTQIFWDSLTTIPTNVQFPTLGLFPAFDDSGETPFSMKFSWQGWYRPLFVGIAASERIKIIPMEDCMIGVAPIHLPFGSNVAGNAWTVYPSTISPMTFCGPNRGAEVVCPYYENAKFLYACRFYDPTVAGSHGNPSQSKTIQIQCFPMAQSGTPPPYNIYHSFGPDIRVVGFRGVPTVTMLNLGPDTSYQYFFTPS